MSATVYSPSGTTQKTRPRWRSSSRTAVPAVLRRRHERARPERVRGRAAFPPNGRGPCRRFLAACDSARSAHRPCDGITVIDGQGAPETGPGSTLTPADLAPQGSTDFNNPAGSSGRSGSRFVESVRPAVARGRQGQPDYDFLDEVTGGRQRSADCRSRSRCSRARCSPSPCPRRGRLCRPAERVTFSATVTGQNGSALSYSWNFGGGAPNSTAASPQVTFGSRGTVRRHRSGHRHPGAVAAPRSRSRSARPPRPPPADTSRTGAGKTRSPTPRADRGRAREATPGGKRASQNTGKSTTTGKGNSTTGTSIDHDSTTPTSTTTRRRPRPSHEHHARPTSHHIAPRRTTKSRPATQRRHRRARPRRPPHPARSSPGCWSAT